jgi:hypothetical protein
MLKVNYEGHLGNNLFQYCFSRIIAEKLGYELVVDAIPGFRRTRDQVAGHRYVTEPIILRGQRPNLDFVDGQDPKRTIIANGYFQRSEYYLPHASKIKRWLAIDDPLEDIAIDASDLVIGIRRGRDYIPRHGLPLSYYETALENIKYKNLFICTDSPDDPFVRYITRKYKGVVRSPGALDNLAFIQKFKKIIISNSTFLWWAAFLSEADEIIFPRPANGFWSNVDSLSKNISLEVDNPRYRYMQCELYKSEFPSEIFRNLIENTRSAIRPLLPWKRVKVAESIAPKFAEDD